MQLQDLYVAEDVKELPDEVGALLAISLNVRTEVQVNSCQARRIGFHGELHVVLGVTGGAQAWHIKIDGSAIPVQVRAVRLGQWSVKRSLPAGLG